MSCKSFSKGLVPSSTSTKSERPSPSESALRGLVPSANSEHQLIHLDPNHVDKWLPYTSAFLVNLFHPIHQILLERSIKQENEPKLRSPENDKIYFMPQKRYVN